MHTYIHIYRITHIFFDSVVMLSSSTNGLDVHVDARNVVIRLGLAIGEKCFDHY